MPDSQAPFEPGPATTLLDPRTLQILSAEHSSLQSARARLQRGVHARRDVPRLPVDVVRGVGPCGQAIPLDRDFLLVAAVVLAFDLVVGLTT